ncbi:tubulin polyglutamylase TTLL4-like isoform X2 [Hermetia illucens]|uniref:tubulin polyglutamylase TTLL4-like isoform X2 n=1 Tax=Hermetia illucens TaxID=343691 RepID=UPI0018CC2A62|nr:tubulin polyglutamylase TTLL4-like isoform X2 [Hermetia illucens]
MSRAGNCQCSGRLSSKALISDDPLLHSAERDDSIENLRNPQPIFFEESYSIQDRLYDVNIFNGCIHKDYLHRSLRNSFGRPRYSESEKDTYYAVKESDEPIRQQIRTRSESEPSDIRNMNKWRIRSQFKLPLNDRLCERENILDKMIDPSQTEETRLSSVQLRKDGTLPRLFIYNNKPRVKSPLHLKKVMRYQTSPVLGSPRLNRVRGNKPKPCAAKTTTTSLKLVKPIRKSKFAISSKRIPIESKAAEIYPSFGGKEHDTVENADFQQEDITCNDGYHFSSDLEMCYKDDVYLQPSSVQESVVSPRGKTTIHFVTSLFPNVPPFLSFSTHTDKRPPMSPYLYKVLKWKLTNVMPKLIRRVLISSGFRLLKKTNDWMGIWSKHMKSTSFKTVRSYQKFNHIPGSFKIGRKDSCWRNLQAQMIKHGNKEFGFMPKTYIIPQDLNLLKRSWPKYSQRNFKWIIKPPASARGTGIKVINRWAQIPKRKSVIVQRYIEKPFLINGSKFDLRLYVLVTSINPLRVYLYQDGLVRFASVKYSERADSLNDRYMHLTNYSINKLSSTYSQNEDVNACEGHKWTIQSLWSYLKSRRIDTIKLWDVLRNLILRTLLAGENSINAMFKLNVESKYNCFELFGFDVILDSELVPWLLEVNISPSLHSELPLDLHVKGPLIQAVLNTALYNVPPKLSLEHQKLVLAEEGLSGRLCYDKRIYITYLSREEKLKHNQFTRVVSDNRKDVIDNTGT